MQAQQFCGPEAPHDPENGVECTYEYVCLRDCVCACACVSV